jgi:peptide/nickel transport system permease protein
MTGYILRRLGLSLVQLVALSVFAFLLMQLVPGNPVTTMLGAKISPSYRELVYRHLGLNRPIIDQLGSYIAHTFTGHFGYSYTLNQSISSLISGRLEPSAFLIVYGMLVAVVIGVPLAIVAATHAGKSVDLQIRMFVTTTYTLPSFWLGLVLAVVFGLKLHILPVSGFESGFVGQVRSLTLPAFALGLSLLAVVVRLTRASMRKVLASEYVEAVTARGLSTGRILSRHVMRNAIMPTVSVLAVTVGALVSGTAVLEQVFQIPGEGSLLIQAVQNRDYPVVQAVTLLAGAVVIIAGLAADILQAAVDPRVRQAVQRG